VAIPTIEDEDAKRANRERRSSTRKTMIVALARKLLIVLWRIVTTGTVPTDLKLRRIAT
jgi:hypothetical protein